MSRTKVAIIGAAGYTGGELIRILIDHPQVDIVQVTSRSQAGKRVSEVHDDLLGRTDLLFTDTRSIHADVVFLCLPHGESGTFLEKAEISKEARIIDLSHDFRLERPGNDFIYGLPELNRKSIKQASRLANPGCFATAIQLAMLPLAKAGRLKQDVHVSAITGSTGAGVSSLPTTHFTWRTGNMSVYKAFEHQHLAEIRQSMSQLQADFNSEIFFIPYRGNFTRGIIATVYMPFKGNEQEAVRLYSEYFSHEPFVHLSEQDIHLKQAVNTNNAILQVKVRKGQVMVTSVIDNLLKGASGQAVQNMNLMLGIDESAGLNVKPIGY